MDIEKTINSTTKAITKTAEEIKEIETDKPQNGQSLFTDKVTGDLNLFAKKSDDKQL